MKMELSMFRIGINTFAVYAVGQPMRYDVHFAFYTNTSIIHLRIVYFLDIMTRLAVSR